MEFHFDMHYLKDGLMLSLLWPWIWCRTLISDGFFFFLSLMIANKLWGNKHEKCGGISTKNSNTPLIIYCGPMEHFGSRHLTRRERKKNIQNLWRKSNNATVRWIVAFISGTKWKWLDSGGSDRMNKRTNERKKKIITHRERRQTEYTYKYITNRNRS